MRLIGVSTALVLFSAEAASAHGHHHAHRRHVHVHHPRSSPLTPLPASGPAIEKRASCTLPDDGDLHYVPGAQNAGFAMSPDQPCTAGMYCPIACKPGKVMAQWEPGSSYNYPSSMNGGLYCDSNGQAKKPFGDSPYCVDGTGSINAVNEAGPKVSFCQTVLPGNEAMLIPTVVEGSSVLAVPGTSYWASTAAHYYINPPGVGEEGCIWGDNSKPVGNWAPYVAGANTDKNGQTFVKLGFNPIFEFEGAGLEKNPLTFGVRIECPDGGCNGLPCELNPAKKRLGEVVSDLAAVGAGGSSFCVVTVPAGRKANIVVFNTDGSTGNNNNSEDPSSSEASEQPTSSPAADEPGSTSVGEPETTSSDKSSSRARPTVGPGIFRETDGANSNSSSTKPTGDSAPTSSDSAPTETQSNENEAHGLQQGSAAVVGLVVALAAAAVLY